MKQIDFKGFVPTTHMAGTPLFVTMTTAFAAIASQKGTVETSALKQQIIGAGLVAKHQSGLVIQPEQKRAVGQAFTDACGLIWGQDKKKLEHHKAYLEILEAFDVTDGSTGFVSPAVTKSLEIATQRAGMSSGK